MFSIYGTSGPLFRGSLEDLSRVSATLGVARVQPINPVLEHINANALQMFQTDRRQPVPSEGRRTVWPDNARRALGAYVRQGATGQPEAQRHVLSRVEDVMATDIVTVSDHASIENGWQILADAGLGQAPVLNREGALVGLFMRAALLRLDRLPGPAQGLGAWSEWLAQPVSSLMVTPVPAAFGSTELRRVARVLLDTQLPGMPVLGTDEKVVGFVSRSDVLKAVVNDPPLDLWS